MATVTVKQLGEYMNEVEFNKTYRDRFSRILKFFGYEATQANVVEFLTMILDNPESYKKTDDIIRKWKKPKSASDMFTSIISVCNIPKIKSALGERFDMVVAAHDTYIKDIVAATKTCGEGGNGNTKSQVHEQYSDDHEHEQGEVEQQAYHWVPPSEKELSDFELEEYHEDEDEDDQVEDEADNNHSNAVSNKNKLKLKLKHIPAQKMLIYIEHLRRSSDPIANLVADLMMYDINAF